MGTKGLSLEKTRVGLPAVTKYIYIYIQSQTEDLYFNFFEDCFGDKVVACELCI